MTLRLSTPVWGELEDVYEPREDSFFLLDTLEQELSDILASRASLLLEIGSGSGVIISSLSTFLGSSTQCVAVDINPLACTATRHTASLNNNKNIDVIQGDLLSQFVNRNMVDMLVFNPPYVVTPDEEITGSIERSWAGGTDGTIVLNRLLPQLDGIMSSKGFGYFVLIEENKPDEIIEKLKLVGFSAEVIARKKIPGEKLCILKFYRP